MYALHCCVEMTKYLVVGLGNIGAEYAYTRHNIGFMVADRLAEEMEISFSTARYASIARGKVKNAELVIIKPSTYMNLSGDAVRYHMAAEKIPIERIRVIVDDLALPFGEIRLRASGSAAGHNGLKHIEQQLGSADYARLRIGIGHAFSRGGQIDYVLGHFTETETSHMPPILEEAVNAIIDSCLEGVSRSMNHHNKKLF